MTIFLIPGIILFMVNGLLPLAIAILTITRAKYFEWLIIAGAILLKITPKPGTDLTRIRIYQY
jgi:hypothetical protein